jgi:hypothetical protein
MQLRTIFTINYIYAFLFGAGFMFFPTFCSSLVGFDVAGDSYLIARCLGIFVTCTGILTFFAKDSAKSPARRAIVISLFILYILLFIFKLLLNSVHDKPVNLIIAFIYVLHSGFIVAYGYHLFGKPREINP